MNQNLFNFIIPPKQIFLDYLDFYYIRNLTSSKILFTIIENYEFEVHSFCQIQLWFSNYFFQFSICKYSFYVLINRGVIFI